MSETFTPAEGGCTCGEVRYRALSMPLIVHACHCRWCQRQTGAPHALNAVFESDRIEVTRGAVEEVTVASPSGAGQIIARCPTCRIALWSNYLSSALREHLRFLRVGTLDNPDLMGPDVHIYTSAKMPWYVIPEGHLAVDEFYDLGATWSPESLARMAAWKDKVEALEAG